MAYREENPGELCARCDRSADAGCPRCESPYCNDHLPPSDRRCDPCESEYLGRETNRVRKVTTWLLVAAGAVGLVAVVTIHAVRNGFITGPTAHLAPLLLYASLAAMVGAFALPPVLKRSLRKRFLGERRRRSKSAAVQ